MFIVRQHHSNIKSDSLKKEPAVIYINGDIDASAYKNLRLDLSACLDAQQELVPIIINSNGGFVSDGLAMADCILNYPYKIATILQGNALSMGAVLFSCGCSGHRFISSAASVMIHQVLTYQGGKLADAKTSQEHAADLNTRVLQLLDKQCGKKQGYFMGKIKQRGNTDWYLTAQEAVNLGLASTVGIPNLIVKTNLTYSLA